jgi:membrane protease YdiL (CAAX protease family)
MKRKTALWSAVADVIVRTEQQRSLGEMQPQRFDWRTAIVLTTVAVCLTLQNYLFRSSGLSAAVELAGRCVGESRIDPWRETLNGPGNQQLAGLMYWALGTYVTYVILPVAVAKFALRVPLAELGCGVRGTFRGAWMYAVMFACMAGPIWFFSGTASFQSKYPFYRVAPGELLWPRFYIWEAFYFVQFFALEFFFRGFLLHGVRHRFGFYSIFVMTVPYCMIHFGKPMPETFGAIAAGIILGFMSLKTGRIWLGAVLHVAVAASMDWMALLRGEG